MPRAVRFYRYGSVDVLNVVDVERPQAGPGRVLVRVITAGINPGDARRAYTQLEEGHTGGEIVLRVSAP